MTPSRILENTRVALGWNQAAAPRLGRGPFVRSALIELLQLDSLALACQDPFPHFPGLVAMSSMTLPYPPKIPDQIRRPSE